MQLQNITIAIIAGVIGFFSKIFLTKFFEKKVDLVHELEEPSVFSAVPPSICFQNLTIRNKGNQPAKELRINLKATAIKECNAVFSIVPEERYEQDSNGNILTLKFSNLLPKDKLTISFKSDKPLAKDFVSNIKSNEMLSQLASPENMSGRISIAFRMMVLLFVIIIPSLLPMTLDFLEKNIYSKFPWYERVYSEAVYVDPIKAIKEKTFRLSLITDKNIYKKKQSIDVVYHITNLKKETLNDIHVMFAFSRFEDDLFVEENFITDKPQVVEFLKEGEQRKFRKTFFVPSNMIPGAYWLKLIVAAEGNGKEPVRGEESHVVIEIEAE